MSNPLIIKGALYKDGNSVLRAHFTGEFWCVDCTEYKTKKEIRSEYDTKVAKQFLDNSCIIVDDVKYFECEYSPYNTENFVLLSDLDDLEFFDDNFEFKT